MEHGWGFKDGLVELVRLFWLNFSFHDLRHEAISRIFEKGLNVPEVASITGHKTASQLFRYVKVNL